MSRRLQSSHSRYREYRSDFASHKTEGTLGRKKRPGDGDSGKPKRQRSATALIGAFWRLLASHQRTVVFDLGHLAVNARRGRHDLCPVDPGDRLVPQTNSEQRHTAS